MFNNINFYELLTTAALGWAAWSTKNDQTVRTANLILWVLAAYSILAAVGGDSNANAFGLEDSSFGFGNMNFMETLSVIALGYVAYVMFRKGYYAQAAIAGIVGALGIYQAGTSTSSSTDF